MRVAALSLILAAGCATPALAQQVTPIGPFVIDVRGFTTKLGADAVTAADLLVATTNLPTRSVGGAIGAQVYFRRSRDTAVGIGVEALLGRARSPLNDATGVQVGTVEQRVEGVAGEISINFGHRDGWSYLSAGLGPLRLEAFTAPPVARPAGKLTANAGAGARWFMTRHIAFCFDVRLYLAKTVPSMPGIAGRGKRNLLVLSAGLAIK